MDNAATGEIVRREIEPYSISRQHSGVSGLHGPGDMPEHPAPVVQLDREECVRKRFFHRAVDGDAARGLSPPGIVASAGLTGSASTLLSYHAARFPCVCQ